MKKQLQRGISCFLCCLLLTAAVLPMGCAAADANEPASDTEQRPLLIILLDVSGTMKQNDASSDAVAWAVALSANFQELEVDVEAITFGEQIKSLDLKTVSNKPGLYGEKRTKHSEAMEKAEKIVNENPARKTCIVMLSDGALDLRGRGLDDVDEDAERTDEEEKAIESFQETCERLGAEGCQLFLVGCGASDGDLEDPYAIRGFGMLKSLDGKTNCRFLRARELDLSKLTEYVFCSLGYQSSVNENIQMTDGTIRFSLDQSYYKTHICVSRTSDAPVEKERIVVKQDGEEYPASSFHVNNNYKSMIVLCLDEPSAGQYEIVLPNMENNTYTLLHQTSFDIQSLNIKPTGKQVEYVSSRPPTYAIPDKGAGCQLEISLDHSGIAKEDIGKCWYTVQLEPTDSMTNGDTNPPEVPFSWGEDLSSVVVPLELPEPSPKSLGISAVTYTIQAYLTIKDKDDDPIKSDLIRIQLGDIDPNELVCKEFSGCAGHEIDISPLKWSEVDANDDLNYIQYYMLEQALVPGETLTGKIPLTIPCKTEVYEVVRNAEGTVKITFEQPGEYFMAINLYGQAKAREVGHFTIKDAPDYWIIAIIAAAGIVFAAVVLALVKNLRKKKH